MSFDIILQVRYSSKRLPGKILLNLGSSSVIEYLIKNLKKIKIIRRIILAVPNDTYQNIFKHIAKYNFVKFYVSQDKKDSNVLKRFYDCSNQFGCENIIRITPDCPFINNRMVEIMVNYFQNNNLNFLVNNFPRKIPHGFDCEIFSSDLLKRTHKKAKSFYDREHVTSWMYKNAFKNINYIEFFNKNYSNLRLTLDYAEDYLFFIKNFNKLKQLPLSKKPEIILDKII